jgi:ElaB/YqjD/DUF883 family membrane-anchored ribosome-binding protein
MCDRDDPLNLDAFSQSLHQSLDCIDSVKRYGINPTAAHMLRSAGLLSTTSPEAIAALESLSYHDGDAAETAIACESLWETIKTKVTQWSSKVLNFFSGAKSKLTDRLHTLFDRLKAAGQKARAMLADGTAAATKQVKAHPYKTVALVVAAAVAALGIGAWAIGALPAFGEAASLTTFMSTLAGKVSAIKWPFGKIVATLTKSKLRIGLTIAAVGAAGAAAAIPVLGWNKMSAGEIVNDADRLVRGGVDIAGKLVSKAGSAVKAGWMAVRRGAHAIVQSGHQGYHQNEGLSEQRRMRYAGVNMTITTFGVVVAGVGYLLFKLFNTIVVGGLKLMYQTLRALTRADDAASFAS